MMAARWREGVVEMRAIELFFIWRIIIGAQCSG
jgi:hypothetical protein